MPAWVPTTIVLAYTAIVTLVALAAVFSETTERRAAAYKVLLVLLPSGLLILATQAVMTRIASGA